MLWTDLLTFFSRKHPRLCFWLRREGRQMSYAEQLLYQTEKSNHRSFSTKTLFLKFLLYSWENTCVKFLKTPILKNICVVILQKYQSLSNQNFKQNLAHLSSMHLIPTLSCEPRFRVFTVNDYKIKSKCL